MVQFVNEWKKNYRNIESIPLTERSQRIFMTILVLVILAIRLMTINTPSLKWTAWKEIDYLYISQNYWKQGFDFLHPEVGWPAEPPRVTEMEFPLVPFMASILYSVLGFSAYTARAITLLAFLMILIYTFKLVKREAGPLTGIIAAVIAGILPLHHVYSKFLFTEPSMIAISVVSLYYFAEWVEHERRRDWLLAIICLSVTIALKLESLYLLLPIGWIAFRKYGWDIKKYKYALILIAIALILPILWYRYAYYLENTGAHLFGIFKGHDKSQTFTMLSDFQWYRTMTGRIIKGILGGYYAAILFVVGIAAAVLLRESGLFFGYLISVVIYFVLVAEGNIDAPYRQLPIIPSISLFVAFGVQAWVALGISLAASIRKNSVNSGNHLIAGACLALILVIPVLNYRVILVPDSPWHWERWNLAQEIRKTVDVNSKLVVIGEYTKHVGGYDLSPVIYYYCGCQGWTLTPEEWDMEYVEGLRIKGATHFVVTPPYPPSFNQLPEESYASFVAEMKSRYPVLYEYEDQLILDLR